MMGHKVGDRVGAILNTDVAHGKVVNFLGYGKYDGFLQGGPLGNFPNPRITLDNGDVVWGCQCWWGGEEKVKAEIAEYLEEGWTIKSIRIGEVL